MEQVPKKARLQGERGLCRWVQRVPKTMHGRGCFSLWKCWGLRPHPQRLGYPPPPGSGAEGLSHTLPKSVHTLETA